MPVPRRVGVGCADRGTLWRRAVQISARRCSWLLRDGGLGRLGGGFPERVVVDKSMDAVRINKVLIKRKLEPVESFLPPAEGEAVQKADRARSTGRGRRTVDGGAGPRDWTRTSRGRHAVASI